MTLLLTLHHRNKENEPSSLNGNAPPRRRRSTAMNPYSQPLPFNQNERNARRFSAVKPTVTTTATTKATGASNASTASQINKDSPAIKRILKATGCSSVEELLARDQQKTQASKGPKAAANRSKTAPNGPKNAMKGAPNVAKTATKGAKSTNGSKTTNPKKKATSKFSISRHS